MTITLQSFVSYKLYQIVHFLKYTEETGKNSISKCFLSTCRPISLLAHHVIMYLENLHCNF